MTEEPIKVVLFAADCGGYDIERSMEELAALAQANGMEAVAEVVQKRETPEAATFLGEGRLAEGRMLCINLGAECAVFDAELSGSQIRNLEELLEVQVIDRTMLILEIFASRAVTNEGKLQTELATLQYRLPRLAGLGASLSRQGGGGGGGAGARRGAGEASWNTTAAMCAAASTRCANAWRAGAPPCRNAQEPRKERCARGGAGRVYQCGEIQPAEPPLRRAGAGG